MTKADRATPPAAGDERSGRINQMKLLIVLDALLREGSVSGAAASMGMQTSAMSRLLGTLRDHFDDRIFIRTGRGLSPTPFAESLRLRVRTLVSEMDALIDGRPEAQPAAPMPSNAEDGWQVRTRHPAPPLSVVPADALRAAPTPAGVARRLAAIGDNADPHLRLAKYIATTAPGPGRSRPLDFEEARDALAIVLRGEADPTQIGALLMTIQYRGATAVELAGFTRAIRDSIALAAAGGIRPDLDWPCYPSPRWRNPPWFIHAARLTAMAGYRVLLHGRFGNGLDSGKLEAAALDADIPVCASAVEISAALQTGNIAYVPLGAIAPQVQSLLSLYPLFQMHTPLNGVVNLINPLDAPAMVVGASEVSRRDLYRDVARILRTEHMAIIGSVRDLVQFAPERATRLFRIVGDQDVDTLVPAGPKPKREIPTVLSQREYWQAVWSGAARDEQAESIIVHTAALALLCLSRDPQARFEDAVEKAAVLWRERRR